jgi:hypothetical protein
MTSPEKTSGDSYLYPTRFIDSDSLIVINFVCDHTADDTDLLLGLCDSSMRTLKGCDMIPTI